MNYMFKNSKFNGDISNWDVSKVENMREMFDSSDFTGENGDISNWDISNVEDMTSMFGASEFNGNLSKWNLNDKCLTFNMFKNSPLTRKRSKQPKNM